MRAGSAPLRHPRAPQEAGGQLLVFLGAKGGAGVTTLACNFAVSLAQESGQSTLLIDLDLPLGDAALNLGIVAEYSTINALQDAGRLDRRFLDKLLIKHSSGVSVLAAPGKFPQYQATNEAIDKLMAVARQEFDNVVVDVGSRLDLTDTALFKDASAIYLVTQAGIPELRNSNRLISQFFTAGGPKLEIVINRYEPRSLGVAEETHHQGAHPAGHLEDSQRLRGRAADAEHGHAAGPGRLARFRASSSKWRFPFAAQRLQRKQKRKASDSLAGTPLRSTLPSMEGEMWNC